MIVSAHSKIILYITVAHKYQIRGLEVTFSDTSSQVLEVRNQEGSMNGFKFDPPKETSSVRVAITSRWDTANTDTVGLAEVQVAGYPLAGNGRYI